MRIIGIAGAAGSGKTTFGALLAGHLLNGGYNVLMDAFATGVKRTARQTLGWDGTKGQFWRRALQEIGSAARTRNEDCWVISLAERVAHDDFVIVPDMRYLNELAWLRRPTRDDAVIGIGHTVLMTGRAADLGPNGAHASERELSEAAPEAWDVVVHNAGDLRVLNEQAFSLATGLMDSLREGPESLPPPASGAQVLLTLRDDASGAERFDQSRATEGWDSRVRPGVAGAATSTPTGPTGQAPGDLIAEPISLHPRAVAGPLSNAVEMDFGGRVHVRLPFIIVPALSHGRPYAEIRLPGQHSTDEAVLATTRMCASFPEVMQVLSTYLVVGEPA